MVQPKKIKTIKTIPGKTPILLIAPHGVDGDDDNTGKIAKLMAERLNCYAVINEHYQRPVIIDKITGEKKAGPADPKNELFDLNDLTHVRKYLEVEFLRPIIDYTTTIHRDHGTPLVILIHGIKDKRIKHFYGSTPNIVMGIGLPDNLSCVKLFAECLKDLLPEAVFSDETLPKKSDNYSGRLPKNLNQLFTDSHSDFSGINFDVQSIQLEIKKKGFRDTTKNYEKAAERLSVALTELLGLEVPAQAKGEGKGKEVVVATSAKALADADDEKTNIIIIAPHAHPDDGAGTGDLVREISKHIDCHTIINEEYRRQRVIRTAIMEKMRVIGTEELEDRPALKEKVEPVNKNKKVVDWNRISQAEKHLQEEYLQPLKNYLSDSPNTLVLFVYGISDKDMALVGTRYSQSYWEDLGLKEQMKIIGQNKCQAKLGSGGDSFAYPRTASTELVLKLQSLLENNNNKPISTESTASYYAGSQRYDMNQWFRQNGYIYPELQSFQLAIRRKGFIDNQDNLKATAKAIANALKEITKPIQEEAVDNTLVKEASTELIEIFYTNVENAMLEVGKYLIDTFYGGSFKKARLQKPVKDKSLNYLIQNIRNQDSNAPSRAWLYRSVQLAVEYDEIEKQLPPESFYTYRQLLLSHKILLLPVTKMAEKEQLIQEIADNNFTVVQLRERLADIDVPNKPALPAPLKITQVIKKPDLLFSPDYSAQIKSKSLAKLTPKAITKLRTKAQEQKEKIEAEVAKQSAFLKSYSKLIKVIDKAEKAATKAAKKKSARGTYEWADKEVNCCTGCSNGCLYCYAKYREVYRFKRVKEDEWPKVKIREHNVIEKHKKYGTAMFPTSHDIFPENIEECTTVIQNLLDAGNKVLIVSKPRLECIKDICESFKKYKNRILFRFTIGAMDDKILSLWEPNAPFYEERKKSLKYALENGYKTSVSAEPMLDADHIDDLVADLLPYITDALWIGKMNDINSRVKKDNAEVKEAVKMIEAGQTDENILNIYARHKDNPQIKWKDSIKDVVGMDKPDKIGMDV